MGGTSSTRKITLVNDEESGVIKISDSVVKRLRGELEQSTNRKAADGNSAPTPTSEHLSPPRPPHPGVQQPAQAGLLPKQSGFTSYEDLRNQALRMNRERDEEIGRLEAEWMAKLYAAEEQNNIVQDKMAEKFTAAVEEVGKLFPTRPCEPVCTDVQQKVQRCYEANQKTSLNCSKEVREFSECVQHARLLIS